MAGLGRAVKNWKCHGSAGPGWVRLGLVGFGRAVKLKCRGWARPGGAGHGAAWRGGARQLREMSWRGEAWRGTARPGLAVKNEMSWRGEAWLGEAGLGSQMKCRGEGRPGTARQGGAGHGKARLDVARLGSFGEGEGFPPR